MASPDWYAYGRAAAKAMEESGVAADVMLSQEDPELFDVAAGKPTIVTDMYPTAVIIKNFTVADQGFADPEHLEVTFHSGLEPDTVPDLLNEDNVQLMMLGKIYKVTEVTAIRPAGITMLYKGKAKESEVL